MARSEKHDFNFKYTKHNKVFDDRKDDNLKALGQFKTELLAKGEHIELRSPKHFEVSNKGRINTAYSLTWYTRKKLGAKKAVTV